MTAAPRGRRLWELAPVGRATLPGGKRVHSAASNGERIRVAGAARPARSSAREPAVGASPRGASSNTRRRAGPPGGEQRRAAPRGWRGAPRRVSRSARPARSSVVGEQLPAGEGLRGGEQRRAVKCGRPPRSPSGRARSRRRGCFFLFSYFSEIEMHVELYGLYLSCDRFFE